MQLRADNRQGTRRRARTRNAIAAIACAGVATLGLAEAAAAAPGNGIDRSSRITLALGGANGVTATAQHEETLYLASDIGKLGYRAAGLAAFDTANGTLDRDLAELDGANAATIGSATRVVADGDGGAYVVGVTGSGADGVRQRGLLHVEADGDVDTAFRPVFRGADGRPTTDVRDVAVGADGTVYVAGAFASVGDAARDGLAALDPATGTARAWRPTLTAAGGERPAVDRIAVAGTQLLVSGSFNRLGEQARPGLGGVALGDAAPTAWAPAGQTASDASVALLIDGTDAYLASRTAVKAVTTTGAGTVSDLELAPDGDILGVALSDDGSLYATGTFGQIAGSGRSGLAEIDPDTGDATAWDPGSSGTTQGSALAVDDDQVYVATIASDQDPNFGGQIRCGAAAVSRTSGAVTNWDPGIVGRSIGCDQPPTAFAISGGRVWAAGGFRSANMRYRFGFAAIDVADDEILPWAPYTDTGGIVHDLAVSPDGETVYVLGSFGAINEVPRAGAAALAGVSAGAAQADTDITGWDPSPAGTASTLALDPSADGEEIDRIYLGGSFGSLDGEAAYARLGAVTPDTGAPVTSFRPAPDGPVNALELAADGTLYVAGDFRSIGSAPASRRSLAAFAGGGDVPTAWNPQLAEAAGGAVLDLAVGADAVYAAGTFDGTIGGVARRGVAKLDRTGGSADAGWNAQASGSIHTVTLLSDGSVALVGQRSGVEQFTLGGRVRPAAIGSVTAAGAVTAWSPQASAFRPAFESWGNEVRELAGRTIVPGRVEEGIVDGVADNGLLLFATATLPDPIERPVVLGTPRPDQSLTCQPGWYGLEVVALSYEWLRDGAPIPGATGTSYVVQAADRGRAIACRETAENAAGSRATTSDAVQVVADRPQNSEPPEVSGTVQVGATATCARGGWSGSPTEFRYRWLLDGAPIQGATGQTYAPVEGQAGRGLSCEVVAVNAAGESQPAVSAARTIAAGQQPTCEQLGNCPPPTCQQLGNCPQPTCQQLGNCPQPTCQQLGNCPVQRRDPPPVRNDPPSNGFTVPGKRASAGGLLFTLDVPGPGTVSISATTRLGRRTLRAGSARASARGAGRVSARLNLTAAARRALARRRSLRLTVRFTFTPTGGTPSTITQTIVVRPARRAGRGRGGRRGRR